MFAVRAGHDSLPARNSKPVRVALTRKSPGPLSTAQANVHSESQSRKLSTVISSLSDLRIVKKKSICITSRSRSELRCMHGKSCIFPAPEFSHQLRNGRCVALCSSRLASDGIPGSCRTLPLGHEYLHASTLVRVLIGSVEFDLADGPCLSARSSSARVSTSSRAHSNLLSTPPFKILLPPTPSSSRSCLRYTSAPPRRPLGCLAPSAV